MRRKTQLWIFRDANGKIAFACVYEGEIYQQVDLTDEDNIKTIEDVAALIRAK